VTEAQACRRREGEERSVDNEAEPSEATLETERADAAQAHSADRPPTSEEEAAAERALEDLGGDRKEVAEHFQEMSDIGAHVKGEGAIE
jgi:hypothetical protein